MTLGIRILLWFSIHYVVQSQVSTPTTNRIPIGKFINICYIFYTMFIYSIKCYPLVQWTMSAHPENGAMCIHCGLITEYSGFLVWKKPVVCPKWQFPFWNVIPLLRMAILPVSGLSWKWVRPVALPREDLAVLTPTVPLLPEQSCPWQGYLAAKVYEHNTHTRKWIIHTY